MKIVLILSVVILFYSCKENHNPEESDSHTVETHQESTSHNLIEANSYQHPDGTICHAQSPINILSFSNNSKGMHNITFNFKDEINAIENLGHTIQLDFKKGSTVTVDDEVFQFKQLHFHTPSEHLLDGVRYPMEMHMVNTLQGQKEGETPQFLVISILFKMGKESMFIDEFINTIPNTIPNADDTKEIETGKVLIKDLISEKPEEILDSYYHYIGSLTTPPYTESVRWYVSKHIFEASPDQIKKILDIEGENARQVQSLNDRELESN
ncbi:MAG: carbonic anhydrase [Dokdonia sp.]|jgi:carbonic anhydrase